MVVKNANAKRWSLKPHATAGRVFSSAYPPPVDPGAISAAIEFPSNGGGGTVCRFDLTGAAKPNIQPLTLLWKLYPIQHTSYYTTFFHGRSDGSLPTDISTNYWGCHPYPDGGAGGTTHKWEIAVEGNDDVVDENGNDTAVIKDQWYSQAASSRANGGSSSIIDFYWDLDISTNRRISRTTAAALANDANSPALVFGDAPWSANNERLSGRLRGIQVYTEQLSEVQIVALEAMETDAAVLAKLAQMNITSLWYLNMNPTPSDITDKSGAGHNPTWASANHGTLWTP